MQPPSSMHVLFFRGCEWGGGPYGVRVRAEKREWWKGMGGWREVKVKALLVKVGGWGLSGQVLLVGNELPLPILSCFTQHTAQFVSV